MPSRQLQEDDYGLSAPSKSAVIHRVPRRSGSVRDTQVCSQSLQATVNGMLNESRGDNRHVFRRPSQMTKRVLFIQTRDAARAFWYDVSQTLARGVSPRRFFSPLCCFCCAYIAPSALHNSWRLARCLEAHLFPLPKTQTSTAVII